MNEKIPPGSFVLSADELKRMVAVFEILFAVEKRVARDAKVAVAHASSSVMQQRSKEKARRKKVGLTYDIRILPFFESILSCISKTVMRMMVCGSY